MSNKTKGLFMAAVCFAFLAAPTLADDQKTEKLWRIECSGIGGWGAASQAKRVRATLEKVRGVREVEFDTTAVGYLKMRKGVKPDREKIEKELPRGVEIKTLEEQDVPVSVAKWELTVRGMSWQGTCMEIREIFAKVEDVSRVHPYGGNGTVIVHVTDKKALTREKAEELLKDHEKFSLRKFKRAS